MNALDLILARTNLAKTLQKLQNSRDEIQQKNAHREDLLKSMNESIEEVTFSYVTFCELELEYRVARQRANDLEYLKFGDLEALRAIVMQNDKLREQNERLKENL